MFGSSRLELPPPPVTAPPAEVIDCLVEDRPGEAAERVRWLEFVPGGLLADLLAAPAQTKPEQREFEALERIGAWERVVAWAQARQAREMTWLWTARRHGTGLWGLVTPRLMSRRWPRWV
ncbi:MAG TPA: hypothetical protein VE645_03575 [Pseudonocardiaceae bacterium]|jgi:hypothetical protein|nr:hypothetical protein [Pseudonocardiaceae bacterium]